MRQCGRRPRQRLLVLKRNVYLQCCVIAGRCGQNFSPFVGVKRNFQQLCIARNANETFQRRFKDKGGNILPILTDKFSSEGPIVDCLKQQFCFSVFEGTKCNPCSLQNQQADKRCLWYSALSWKIRKDLETSTTDLNIFAKFYLTSPSKRCL